MQKILVLDTETADLTGSVYDVGFVIACLLYTSDAADE